MMKWLSDMWSGASRRAEASVAKPAKPAPAKKEKPKQVRTIQDAANAMSKRKAMLDKY